MPAEGLNYGAIINARKPLTATVRDRAADRLRSLASAPVTAPARREVWARRLVKAGVVDRPYYELQTGKSFSSDEAAARHLMNRQPGEDYSPHPLFEAEWLLDGLEWNAEKLAVAYLVENAAGTTPGPVALTQSSDGRGPLELLKAAEADPSTAALRRAVLENARAFAHERSWLSEVSARRAATTDPAVGTTRSVTVIVPTGVDRADLEARLEVLRGQSLPMWHALVVGDDELAADVLLASGIPEDRVTSIRADGPPSRILQAAVDRSPEGALAFLVQGSRWDADVLSRGVVRCRDDAYAWFSADVWEHGSTEVSRTANDLPPRALAERGADTPLSALVVDRDLLVSIGGFDTSLAGAEDLDLVVRLAEAGRGVRAGQGVRLEYPQRSVKPLVSTDPRVWEKQVASKHLIDWDHLEESVADRVPGRISVCMPTFQDWAMTQRAVDAILEHCADDDVEVVVVDNGSRRSVSAILTALYHDEPRVVLVRSPRNHNFSTGSNLAFAHSSGEFTLFLNNDTVVAPGALATLRARLVEDDSVVGVQPLLLYPDGLVQAAGTFFNGERIMPWHFLSNHPRSDALRADIRRFSAVTAAAVMLRSSDVAALRGFDPLFVNGLEDVDLCMRGNLLRDDAHFEVVLEATIFHHESKSIGRQNASALNRGLFDVRWRGRYPGSDLPRYRAVGLEAIHTTAASPQPFRLIRTSHPVVVRPPRLVEEGPSAGRPCLRWAVKVDTTFDEYDFGPETTDAVALRVAEILRAHGQEVVVDEREAHYRPTDYLDDVTVTVQGDAHVAPQPGAVSFLWTTGEPAVVSEDEAHSYDFIVAAGEVTADDGRPETQSIIARSGDVERDVVALLETAAQIIGERRAHDQ